MTTLLWDFSPHEIVYMIVSSINYHNSYHGNAVEGFLAL
jgi:hypothetical protein